MVSIAGIIFSRGYENKGLMEGFRFGLLVGLLLASQVFVAFVWSPIPQEIFNGWVVGHLLEGVIIGLSLAMVFGMNLGDEKLAKKPTKKPAAKKKK